MSCELQKGEALSLTQLVSRLDELVVGIKCDKKAGDATDYEFDTSVFLLTKNGNVRSDADFIFYNQEKSEYDAVILKNNLVKITLNKLSADINTIVLVLTLHEARQRQQHFGLVDKVNFKLFSLPEKQEIASYCFEQANNETGIIFAQIYRYQNEWKLKAIGQGFTSGLEALAKHFGVTVDAEPSVPTTITPEESPTHRVQTEFSVTKDTLQEQIKPAAPAQPAKSQTLPVTLQVQTGNSQKKPSAQDQKKPASPQTLPTSKQLPPESSKKKNSTQAKKKPKQKSPIKPVISETPKIINQTKTELSKDFSAMPGDIKNSSETNVFSKLAQKLFGTTVNSKLPTPTDITLNTSKSINAIDIHNTHSFSEQQQYLPIVNWLKLKQINANVNPDAMDTTGFFDEIAVALGNNYALLKIVSDAIKRRHRIGKEKAYIDVSRHSQEDITRLCDFCSELYEYAFVARYYFNKTEQKIVLQLQTATRIVNFFNGEWLEWFAFMKVIALCHDNNWDYSCTRNMVINFENNDKYEIDVFFLIKDKPLFIECKSGEYREYIDKYSKLRKKLFIDKSRFLFLIIETEHSKAAGLNAMFDMTFVNQDKLAHHISTALT